MLLYKEVTPIIDAPVVPTGDHSTIPDTITLKLKRRDLWDGQRLDPGTCAVAHALGTRVANGHWLVGGNIVSYFSRDLMDGAIYHVSKSWYPVLYDFFGSLLVLFPMPTITLTRQR